jgi:hypothetical protein
MNPQPPKQTFILLVILLIVLIGLAIVAGYLQPRDPKQYYDSLPITMGLPMVIPNPTIMYFISRTRTAETSLTAPANSPTLEATGTFTPTASS